MSERFTGKVAIVTGGAHGIGATTVRRFAAEGAAVVIADIAAEATETACLQNTGRRRRTGRGRPRAAAAAIAFLAANKASYITGVALPVDGGWTIARNTP